MNNENLSISYNKSWRLLIDRGMKKKELQEAGGHVLLVGALV